MTSWGDLARQRGRWNEGAFRNNRHYGLTRYTWNHWRLQVWGLFGVIVTAVYLATVVLALATGGLHLQLLWLIVTVVFSVSRFITVVGRRGIWQGIIGAVLVVEMPYDIFLQYVRLKAHFRARFRAGTTW